MSSPASTPPSLPFVVRSDGRWWGSALALAFGVGLMVHAANTRWLGTYPYFPAGQSPWEWLVGLWMSAVGLALVRCSVRVDEDGVVVTNVFRRHRIAWKDLHGVEVVNFPGSDDSPASSNLCFDRGPGCEPILPSATQRRGENNPELKALAAQLLALKARAVPVASPVQDSRTTPQDRPVTDFVTRTTEADLPASPAGSSAGSPDDVRFNRDRRRRPVAILAGVACVLLVLGTAFIVTSRDDSPASIDAADGRIVYPASEESTPPAPPVELPPPLDLTGQLTGVWSANYGRPGQHHLLVFHADGTMRVAISSTDLLRVSATPGGSATYEVEGQSVRIVFPPPPSGKGCTVVYRLKFGGEGTWNIYGPTSADPACDQSNPDVAWYYAWTRISPVSPAGAIFNLTASGHGTPVSGSAPLAGTWLLPNTGTLLVFDPVGASMTYRIDAAGRIDSAATDHGTATITAEGHINLKSSDADNIARGCADTTLSHGTIDGGILTVDVGDDPCHRFQDVGHLIWGQVQ